MYLRIGYARFDLPVLTGIRLRSCQFSRPLSLAVCLVKVEEVPLLIEL